MQVISRFTPLSMPARPAAVPRPQVEAVAARHLSAAVEKTSGAAKPDSGGFSDILDIINPLQHIPVISTLYRKLTGDEIGQMPRIAGGALYGGVFGSFVSGLVSAVANVFVEALTGKDIGEHFMAAASPEETSPPLKQQALSSEGDIHQNAQVSDIKQAVQAADPVPAPAHDFSQVQSAIEQYKWHMLDNEDDEQSGYWA